MKRLMVVFTGGTIGSKAEGLHIDVREEGSYALLEAYWALPGAREDLTFDTIQPINLLSENLTPDDWVTLAVSIRDLRPDEYAGIIVTHGSDTLAYTACLLGYLLADSPIPIVLTASNYPIADERSNGLRNLSGAIDFIFDASLPGVFAVYEDGQGRTQVYLGTRLMQCETFTDQFRSPYDLPFGQIADRRFVWNDDRRNPKPESLAPLQPLHDWSSGEPALESGIVYIRPYPGLDYTQYVFGGRKPRAVLHDLHHSGTACAVAEGPYSLSAFIRRCREHDIDVYLCPVKDASDAMYASAHVLIEAGALLLEGISIEAALTKLMLVYGARATAAGDTGDRLPAEVMQSTTVYYEKVLLYVN